MDYKDWRFFYGIDVGQNDLFLIYLFIKQLIKLFIEHVSLIIILQFKTFKKRSYANLYNAFKLKTIMYNP